MFRLIYSLGVGVFDVNMQHKLFDQIQVGNPLSSTSIFFILENKVCGQLVHSVWIPKLVEKVHIKNTYYGIVSYFYMPPRVHTYIVPYKYETLTRC